MTRDAQIDAFLAAAGWGAAERFPLAGDASTRRYTRLRKGDARAMLMDAPFATPVPVPTPPYIATDPRPFVAITRSLRALGLSAPEVLAEDLEAGFLLIEDLGHALYASEIAADPALEMPYYAGAIDVLARLHGSDAARGFDLPSYDAPTSVFEAALALDWYAAPDAPVGQADRAEILAEITALTSLDSTVVPVLRDYHAENLLWLPERKDEARVGLLDYQDALMGAPAYDFVSLLEDARRDVSEPVREAMLRRYLDRTGGVEAALSAQVARWGAQRNLKILGIFARLNRRDGKPRYLPMLPRVWAHLERDLSHPDLATLSAQVRKVLPPPTEAHIAALRRGG
ncbi:MAG: phosphotransferase [Pseudomonadota bacterium]